jgi:hypothetical protein
MGGARRRLNGATCAGFPSDDHHAGV